MRPKKALTCSTCCESMMRRRQKTQRLQKEPLDISCDYLFVFSLKHIICLEVEEKEQRLQFVNNSRKERLTIG